MDHVQRLLSQKHELESRLSKIKNELTSSQERLSQLEIPKTLGDYKKSIPKLKVIQNIKHNFSSNLELTNFEIRR